IANACAQLLASVLSFLAVAYRHGSTFPMLAVLRTAAAGLIAFATVSAMMTNHGPAHVVTAGAVSLAVFVAAAMTLGALTPSDWDLIVGLVRRVPPGCESSALRRSWCWWWRGCTAPCSAI